MYRRAAVCSSVGGKEGGEMIGVTKKGEFSEQGGFQTVCSGYG